MEYTCFDHRIRGNFNVQCRCHNLQYTPNSPNNGDNDVETTYH